MRRLELSIIIESPTATTPVAVKFESAIMATVGAGFRTVKYATLEVSL
jgi:hypothetical protein